MTHSFCRTKTAVREQGGYVLRAGAEWLMLNSGEGDTVGRLVTGCLRP